METVTKSTRTSLRELGVAAVATREGEDVRVDWVGARGLHSSLLLTGVKTPQGEATKVHLDHEKGADPQVALKVLADLEAKHQPPA